jgi:hypothetical protein
MLPRCDACIATNMSMLSSMVTGNKCADLNACDRTRPMEAPVKI